VGVEVAVVVVVASAATALHTPLRCATQHGKYNLASDQCSS
jgi:hypothetical protein